VVRLGDLDLTRDDDGSIYADYNIRKHNCTPQIQIPAKVQRYRPDPAVYGGQIHEIHTARLSLHETASRATASYRHWLGQDRLRSCGNQRQVDEGLAQHLQKRAVLPNIPNKQTSATGHQI
jgi:hypothetical protein